MHIAAEIQPVEEIQPLEDAGSAPTPGSRPDALLRTPEELAAIVLEMAASEGWIDRVRLRSGHRWYERLHEGPDHDVWVISWLPGQATGFHDHGESAGAFVVTTGVLEEHRPARQPMPIYPGQPRLFGSEYAHDVRNVSLGPAVSIHAYSPPLTEMNEYELEGNQLIPRERASERAQALGREQRAQTLATTVQRGSLSIEQVLGTARAGLRRPSPDEAFAAVENTGAILVDIRPEGQRASEGHVPGALIVERNVLEWRLDPASSARLPIATDHDLGVIVFCSEGYTSSLAAAALQHLGLWRATDMIGGFQAWRSAGLPTAPASREGSPPPLGQSGAGTPSRIPYRFFG